MRELWTALEKTPNFVIFMVASDLGIRNQQLTISELGWLFEIGGLGYYLGPICAQRDIPWRFEKINQRCFLLESQPYQSILRKVFSIVLFICKYRQKYPCLPTNIGDSYKTWTQ